MVLVFSTTLFLSVALLMSIQPLFAKAILPLFGGAPQVWNICMMFYQLLLLAGYLFAYWSAGLGRRGVYLQLVLLILPGLFLPIGVSVLFAEELLISNPALALLLVLVSSVALPFFVLSTLSPLLQRWLSYTSSEHADDPYFLYAGSNLGSFLGLLAYPLVVEPLWPMEQQSQYWSLMYGVLLFGVFSCAVVVLRRGKPEMGELNLRPASLGWTVNLRWLALAFIPSSLMHAVSMHMVSEVASIPLLWVVPLGIYLLTMVLCFAQRKLIPHHWFVTAAPGVVLLILLLLMTAAYDPIGIILPLHLLGLFVLCMLFHGELARTRPATESLTWFYIVLAMGGALGGIFNSLLAPLLFNSIAEYPLILIVATAFIPLRGGAMTPPKPMQQRLLGLLPASLMLAFYEVLELLQAQQLVDQSLVGLLGKVLVLLLPFLGCYLLLKDRLAFALATLSCAGLAYLVNSDNQVIHAQRTFFGVHTLLQSDSRQQRILMNGITVHGVQSTDENLAGTLASYYHPSGPLGQLLGAFGGQFSRIGAIGLGAGSIAAYAAPGDQLDFYEIDEAVIHIAETPALFSFLQQARERGVNINTIAGDARLTLNQAAADSYDVLVIDAFSSGSIPVHLMTQEALSMYQSKLASGGVLAFHISNHYLDFKGPLCDLAVDAGFACLFRIDPELTV